MRLLPVELPRFIPSHHEVWISEDIEEYLRILKANFQASSWWVLTDTNVHQFCYPRFQQHFKQEHQLVVIPAGEASKTLETSQQIWRQFEAMGADRNAVCICLGGGMISDLGGFVSSIWKRGIRFIHIPTSLLGMVDAAIGGKCGIDFQYGKNLLGQLTLPALVVSDTTWLHTLPERELKAGLAECLKHGLVADETYWYRLASTPFVEQEWEFVVYRSQMIKAEVVKTDPEEQWMRKILNFGHSLGHALESLCLELQISLLHGEAVAWGMMAETRLAQQYTGLNHEAVLQVTNGIRGFQYPLPVIPLSPSEIVDKIIYYLKNDKKNHHQVFRMSLISRIGKCEYDIEVSEESIREVLFSENLFGIK
jgi:3-dehydroquinate synthase